MCDPVTLTALAVGVSGGIGMNYLQNRNNKKAKAQTNTQINAADQAAQDQIEANKLANSTQSTEELKNPLLNEELKKQKVPLNTGSTGTQFSTPTSVGLNLGGY